MAHLVRTEDGRHLFLKHNIAPEAGEMFRAEAQGLAILGASGVLPTPAVHGHGVAPGGYAYLILDYIPPGYKNRFFWENFGKALATLHATTSEQFGFAHDNYIGTLPQSNKRHATWPSFFAAERLLPQAKLARQNNRLELADERKVQSLCKRLGEICPPEPPALIHGDLWSGNFLCNMASQPMLIDPAASFSHREMDLAMTRLFGGFEPNFYKGYEAEWPLEPGFEERLPVYQLYYLLAHLNMFGAKFARQVRDILQRI